MNLENLGRLVLLCIAGLLLLRWNLWRAILFLKPHAMRLDPDAPGDQMKLPEALAKAEAEVLSLGFARLGTHVERPPLSRARTNYDYVGEGAWATLFTSPRGEPRLYFLTPTANEGFVITADHRRPALEVPGRYLSGGMDETGAERIYKAHLRRVATIGEAKVTPSLEARVEAARTWYRGIGQREVRQQNMLGLLWTVFSLGMVALAFFTLL